MFAAGCFWGVEEAFRNIDGVASTAVGYSGGHFVDPTYEDVCSGQTGHAEVVLLEFDPQKISYSQLLKAFWDMHDPTTLNRQGPDIGAQYRSAVFYFSPQQQTAAIASKEKAQSQLGRTVVTEITPAGEFYRAEEYHQRYLQRRGVSHC